MEGVSFFSRCSASGVLDWIPSVLPLWPVEAGVFWQVRKAEVSAGVLSMPLTSQRQDEDLKGSIWWKVKCHVRWLWGLATQHLFFPLSFLALSVWNIYAHMLVWRCLGRYSYHCCTSGKVVEHLWHLTFNQDSACSQLPLLLAHLQVCCQILQPLTFLYRRLWFRVFVMSNITFFSKHCSFQHLRYCFIKLK